MKCHVITGLSDTHSVQYTCLYITCSVHNSHNQYHTVKGLISTYRPCGRFIVDLGDLCNINSYFSKNGLTRPCGLSVWAHMLMWSTRPKLALAVTAWPRWSHGFVRAHGLPHRQSHAWVASTMRFSDFVETLFFPQSSTHLYCFLCLITHEHSST